MESIYPENGINSLRSIESISSGNGINFSGNGITFQAIMETSTMRKIGTTFLEIR